MNVCQSNAQRACYAGIKGGQILKLQYKKILDSFFKFKQLNISSIMPDISKGEFAVLMAIKESGNERDGNAYVSEIVEASHCSASAVSRTLRGLESKGHIIRSSDINDRRNTYVNLTESGRAVLNEAETIMNDFLESVLDNMNPDDIYMLNEYISRLYEVCKKEISNRKYIERK